MRLSELSNALATSPGATVRFQLPNGERVAAHAHVTEVACISKRFIDCGGTFREESMCRLQTWVADDFAHRLTADKLGKILEKARPLLLGQEDLEVDVEHDMGFATQFPLESARVEGTELVLLLKGRNTACLAPELCCPPPAQAELLNLGKKRG